MDFLSVFVLAGIAYHVWAMYGLQKAVRERDERIAELVDKIAFNRQPERIVEARKQTVPVIGPSDGMGDPVSVAERKAIELSQKRQQS